MTGSLAGGVRQRQGATCGVADATRRSSGRVPDLQRPKERKDRGGGDRSAGPGVDVPAGRRTTGRCRPSWSGGRRASQGRLDVLMELRMRAVTVLRARSAGSSRRRERRRAPTARANESTARRARPGALPARDRSASAVGLGGQLVQALLDLAARSKTWPAPAPRPPVDAARELPHVHGLARLVEHPQVGNPLACGTTRADPRRAPRRAVAPEDAAVRYGGGDAPRPSSTPPPAGGPAAGRRRRHRRATPAGWPRRGRPARRRHRRWAWSTCSSEPRPGAQPSVDRLGLPVTEVGLGRSVGHVGQPGQAEIGRSEAHGAERHHQARAERFAGSARRWPRSGRRPGRPSGRAGTTTRASSDQATDGTPVASRASTQPPRRRGPARPAAGPGPGRWRDVALLGGEGPHHGLELGEPALLAAQKNRTKPPVAASPVKASPANAVAAAARSRPVVPPASRARMARQLAGHHEWPGPPARGQASERTARHRRRRDTSRQQIEHAGAMGDQPERRSPAARASATRRVEPSSATPGDRARRRRRRGTRPACSWARGSPSRSARLACSASGASGRPGSRSRARPPHNRLTRIGESPSPTAPTRCRANRRWSDPPLGRRCRGRRWSRSPGRPASPGRDRRRRLRPPAGTRPGRRPPDRRPVRRRRASRAARRASRHRPGP